MLMFLAMGLIFGLSAGLAPGPMLTLVMAESLRHGFRAGAQAALSPLVTDLPIVCMTLLLISRMAGSHHALGLISLAGALFLLYIGYETFSSAVIPETLESSGAQSLRKGIITNFLNPHPYLFWMTVGSPTVIRAWSGSAGEAVAFVSGFYLCLVGSKVALAALTHSGRSLLAGRAYRFGMRGLGILLWACAAVLAADGVRFLGA